LGDESTGIDPPRGAKGASWDRQVPRGRSVPGVLFEEVGHGHDTHVVVLDPVLLVRKASATKVAARSMSARFSGRVRGETIIRWPSLAPEKAAASRR
jgi:hypothetical protein